MKWDCGSRVQRALLRNAAAVPGPYKVGDIVSYSRKARQGESGLQWSVGSRSAGFETDPKNPDRPPVTAWVVRDGLPVFVATDRLRPCTAAELLAYQYMQDQIRQPICESSEQQSFIDKRESTKQEKSKGA